MDDENRKKAKQATDRLMLQTKAKEFQDKLKDLSRKEYQGKFKGITVKRRGDFTLFSVSIDQGFYETAGKAQLETAIRSVRTNLHLAITGEREELKRNFQRDRDRFQKEARLNGAD